MVWGLEIISRNKRKKKLFFRKKFPSQTFPIPEDKKSWDVSQDKDPFYEDPEKTIVTVGSCQIYLENLAYKVDLEDRLGRGWLERKYFFGSDREKNQNFD